MKRKKISPSRGWKKAKNAKKMSIMQRLRAFRKSFRVGYYKLGRQIAMF